MNARTDAEKPRESRSGSHPNPPAIAPLPFVGLRPFSDTEEAFFFGREVEARVLCRQIQSRRVTLLFAASGIGKSSLLRARVIPALRKEHGIIVVYFRE